MGCLVVKGKSAIRGFAAEEAASSDDLPTFGYPMIPTSAINLRSSRTVISSPCSPDWAISGACLVELTKCAFPSPPLPPLTATTVFPSSSRSAITSPRPDFRLFKDDCPDRHCYNQVNPVFTVLFSPCAFYSRSCFIQPFMTKQPVIGQTAVCLKYNIAAFSAVTPIRSAVRYILLSTKTHCSVSPSPAFKISSTLSYIINSPDSAITTYGIFQNLKS